MSKTGVGEARKLERSEEEVARSAMHHMHDLKCDLLRLRLAEANESFSTLYITTKKAYLSVARL